MTTIRQNLSAAKLSPRAPSNVGVSILEQTVITSPASVSIVQVGDANLERSAPNVYYKAGKINVSNVVGAYEIKSLNPEIATVASDGSLTRVSSGVAVFLVTANPENPSLSVTKKIRVDLSDRSDGATIDEFDSYRSGALAANIETQIDSRIDNTMTMEANGKLFTTQDHGAATYVRNPNFWAADVDFTCCSPWNSNAANRKAGVLITPRHILGAAHYEFGKGTIVRFVEADGTVHDRTVIGKERHPNYNSSTLTPDLTIYTLSADLPASITPCKVFPANWEDFITKSNLRLSRIAGVGLDQEEKGLIIDVLDSGYYWTPIDADRLIFHENKIPGDSGNPAFVIVNGEPVLKTVWTFGFAGRGTAISDYIADLNQMIVDADVDAGVSTGYTLAEIDLSAFNSY